MSRDEQTPLAAHDLSAGYTSNRVVENLSLNIARGTITTLVGPNGSGKSTLLKALSRLLTPQRGGVYLDGRLISDLPTRKVAQALALLPQSTIVSASLTVGELVEQGRYPHAGAIGMLRRQDHEAIHEALELTSMLSFVERPLDSLSGGERQRAWIALTLAQATPLLLLDEPTTFLDLRHQLEVLELIQRLNQERAMTIIMVLHDLNHAARYSHRMIVLKKGAIVVDGQPQDVLTSDMLAEVFGVHAHIIHDLIDGTPVCFPYATRQQEYLLTGQSSLP